MDDEHALVREVYPELVAELVSLLNAAGEFDLGICAQDLRIIAPCGCTDDFCQSFYTAPPPEGAYGPGHRNLMLDPAEGMIILDVVYGRIMFVELINHPPLRNTLHLDRARMPGYAPPVPQVRDEEAVPTSRQEH